MTNQTSALKQNTEKTKIITAGSARFFAQLFNFGNLLSFLPGLILAPVMLLSEQEKMSTVFMFIAMIVPPILWFGLSIMIYIIARHHPNELVGNYTQQAAYRYYGLIGIVIPVGTFFGTDWQSWILMGGAVGLLIVPWTIWELMKTQKEDWQDIVIKDNSDEGEKS